MVVEHGNSTVQSLAVVGILKPFEFYVLACGSMSGLATGAMLQTKMPGEGGSYPCPVWRVNDDFEVSDDSGTCVIDNATGGICGHAIAFFEFL